MLKYFAKIKQIEISELLENDNLLEDVFLEERPNFLQALQHKQQADGIAVIAEYKRASPSIGDINLVAEPEGVGRTYLQAGAAAMSVLTESTKFKGELGFIKRVAKATDGKLPLLRKDFILHEAQVKATACTPASALLLIVQLSPDVQLLRSLREQAEGFGMQAVVEVFNEQDLQMARESGASIIQVNARDLNTMQVDTQNAIALAKKYRHKGASELWIAASGLENAAQVQAARQVGFDAVLVGTRLMQGNDVAANFAALHRADSNEG